MDDRKVLTVGQLIKLLKGFPEDMHVYADDMGCSFFAVVDAVEDHVGGAEPQVVCTLQGTK